MRAGWPPVPEGNEEHFLLLPLPVFHPKRAKQRHRIASRLPSRPGLGTQGPHRNAPEDPPVEDPKTIQQKNHSCLHIGNLAIPMHVPDVEITDVRKRHQIGAFTSRATVSGLGSSMGCSVLGRGAEALVRAHFAQHPPSLNFGAHHLKKCIRHPQKPPIPFLSPHNPHRRGGFLLGGGSKS